MEEERKDKMNEVAPENSEKEQENKEQEKDWDQKATDDLDDWIEEQGIQLRY